MERDEEINLPNLKGRIESLESNQKHLDEKDLKIIFLAAIASFLSISIVHIFFDDVVFWMQAIWSGLIVVAIVLIFYRILVKYKFWNI